MIDVTVEAETFEMIVRDFVVIMIVVSVMALISHRLTQRVSPAKASVNSRSSTFIFDNHTSTQCSLYWAESQNTEKRKMTYTITIAINDKDTMKLAKITKPG